MIAVLLTVLVAFSCVSAEPQGILDLIPEDILNMIVDLIKSIDFDFDKIWELTKILLCGEDSAVVEERGADFRNAVIRVVRLEERFLEELNIDDKFIELLIDAVKSIDIKQMINEIMTTAKLLVCGEEHKANVNGLEFSFETSKQIIKIVRRLLCGKDM